MTKKKDSIYYMKLCRKCLLEIAELKGQNEERFKVLKKKAEKYLQKARELKNNG